jgi:uncharacterized Zn-finger protein
MSDAIDCLDTNEIVCPYCGYEFSESWTYFESSGNEEKIQCPECDQKFTCSPDYTVTYYSRKL